MYYYVKWEDGTYTECAFNQYGSMYVLNEVTVQRGMGHQKVGELLIQGIPKNKIEDWCYKNNCCVVARDEQVPKQAIRRL